MLEARIAETLARGRSKWLDGGMCFQAMDRLPGPA